MRNKALVAIFIIVVAVGAFQLRHYEPIKSLLLVAKAEKALDAMNGMSADTLVSNSVVSTAYWQFFSNNASIDDAIKSARYELFSEQFCKRVFVEDVEGGKCAMAMEGIIWPSMTRLPYDLYFFASLAKDYTFGYVRYYLADPEQFMRFYFGKRDILIEEFRRQSKDEQVRTVAQVREILVILHNIFFIDSYQEVHDQYETYRLAVFTSQSSNDIKRHYEKVFAFEELGKMVGQTMQEPLFHDEYYGALYLFFAKRNTEGGRKLLKQYYKICFDFLDHVK